jgi:hypothetical protein
LALALGELSSCDTVANSDDKIIVYGLRPPRDVVRSRGLLPRGIPFDGQQLLDGKYLFVQLVISNLGASGDVDYMCWGTSLSLAVEDNRGRRHDVLTPVIDHRYRFEPTSRFMEYFEKPAGQTPLIRQLDDPVYIHPGSSVQDAIVFKDVPNDGELEYLRLELPQEAYRAPGALRTSSTFKFPDA